MNRRNLLKILAGTATAPFWWPFAGIAETHDGPVTVIVPEPALPALRWYQVEAINRYRLMYPKPLIFPTIPMDHNFGKTWNSVHVPFAQQYSRVHRTGQTHTPIVPTVKEP